MADKLRDEGVKIWFEDESFYRLDCCPQPENEPQESDKETEPQVDNNETVGDVFGSTGSENDDELSIFSDDEEEANWTAYDLERSVKTGIILLLCWLFA